MVAPLQNLVREDVWVRYRASALLFALSLSTVIFLGSLFLPPTYRASTTIIVAEKDVHNEWDLFQEESRDVDFEEQARSRAVLEPALRRAKALPRPERRSFWFRRNAVTDEERQRETAQVVNAFQRRLTVERLRHSGVLRVEVSATRPSEAAELANAVAASFIDYRRTQAFDQAQRMVQALDQELASMENDLTSLAAERGTFLSNHGWNDYATERQLAVERLGMLKKSLQSLSSYEAMIPGSQEGSGGLERTSASFASSRAFS